MGEYELEEERINEYPLYKKAEEDHYIFRTKGGYWIVAEERAHVDGDLGWINTKGPAQLPTSEGVTWRHYDGSEWVPDDTISAIGQVSMQCCVVILILLALFARSFAH